MRVASPSEAQKIDRESVLLSGRPEGFFMNQAGLRMAEHIRRQFPNSSVRVGILCGPGHNGGDGFVIARELWRSGWRNITVFILPAENPSLLWQDQFRRTQDLPFEKSPLLGTTVNWKNFDLIVDALFGYGLNRPLNTQLVRLIEEINATQIPVFAVDISSGLNAETGRIMGAAFRCQATMAVLPLKLGQVIADGPIVSGRILPVDVGFPTEVVRRCTGHHWFVGAKTARRLAPQRPAGANKSNFGHLFVMAGSPGMWGAARLACEAAARMGCGYVYIPKRRGMNGFKPDYLSPTDGLAPGNRIYSALLAGPGLGRSYQAQKAVLSLRKRPEPAVIDADALRIFAESQNWSHRGDWILTPHAGEMSAILGWSVEKIEGNRPAAVRECAKRTGCTVLLKGYRSLISQGDQIIVIGSGNSALAKAGTGDVLAGMMASLLAQGFSTLRAATYAAWLHGELADSWVRSGKSKASLMASDLLELLKIGGPVY
ncbi:MAG: NAD(P)H-hydrate dehydratase [Bdellovibrionaceae bacterium]|nr:NAD(P)H-hydrate dehydratase [Pseudobdellovibrionaceae bacterium]